MATEAVAVVGVDIDDVSGAVVRIGVDTSLLPGRDPLGGAVKANGDGQACSKGECSSLEEPKAAALGPCKWWRAGLRKFLTVLEAFVGVRLK